MGMLKRFVWIILLGCAGVIVRAEQAQAVTSIPNQTSGPYAYITNYGSNNVSVIDTANDTVLATIAVGYGPYGVTVSPDATRVYVANYVSSSVSVIDATTNSVLATVPIATRPYGLAVSPDGRHVYVVAYFSNNVSVIDTASNTVTATIPVGQRPHGVVVSQDNKQVYVANYATNDITVIDATLNSVSATIPLPANSNPFGLAQTLDSSKLYVTGWSSNAVYVVDTARKAVTATIPVGMRPVSAAVSPDASRVYVSNYNGSTSITSVSVIDAASNIITNTITVGTRPYAFGSFISLPQPTLSLSISGPDLLNNPIPNVLFIYGTDCNGNLCQVSNNYFSTFDLSAQLNNQPIGSLTTFNPTPSNGGQPGGSASYTPASRLPEGANSLSAQVQDRFGHFTSPLTRAFTVDTIAPKFLTLAPTSGGVYLNPTVTVSGSIDDPTASIYFSSVPLIFFGNQEGPNFTFPTTLVPGLNNINLSAIDLAGNNTKTSLSFTYTPFILHVSSPQNNDSIYGNQVTVSGYFSGTSNASVSVNGVAASVNGVNFTAANVPLISGTNTLLVTGIRADDGKVQTQQLSVFSYAPSIAITAPLNGATFTGNSALVTGTFTGLVATVTVNGVTATLSGNNFSASVPLVFGNNTLVATATTAPAVTVILLSATQTVNVTSSAPSIAIASPTANATLNTAIVAVSGTFNGPSNTSITVNGVAAIITGNTYTATVPVRYGPNTLTANLTAGATTVITAVAVIGTLPSISITAPAANATIAASSVTVSGTFQGPASSTVSVNGVAATVTGNTYTAANVPLTFGSNTLTVTLTAPDNSTASAAVTVTSTTPTGTGTLPSISITAPAANATIAASSVTVSGTFQGPASSTVSVNGVAATVTGNTYTAANVPLTFGSNTLTVTLTAPDNSTASAAVTVTSTTPTGTGSLPSISITAPAANATIAASSVTVSGTFQASTGATVSVNGVAATVTGNTYTAANVPLTFGSNTLTVTVTAPDNSTASAVVTVTSTTPMLTIVSPADGANINGDSILVSGTLLAPINNGVTVNGVVANVENGKFYANNVPLQPGVNILTVIYTQADGTTAMQTHSVNSTGTNPLQVTANAYAVAASLSVNLVLTSQTGSPIQTFNIDPGGNGSVDLNLDGSVSLTYPAPGTYVVNVTITDALGSHSQALAITVWDPAQMDSFFNAVWTGMNNALIAGDKTKALTYLNSSAQAKYGPVFDALLPDMPEIIASYSPLQRLQIYPDIGEYAVNRVIHGVNRIFLIYFLLDNDGVWRIDSM
ncbi:40-residue YVTN family beta-propeller repeat-containing protein [Candidatus Nitrotoga sp. BS]|uniref:cytochrome D1 domain-containing protein n=1 Tax=Candidatus Nitrotoga sp. BS TaxID=2890408 RepID=UPI001EF21ACA|nr:cytochrome D1 domain-containing protein [Candidatus Nitrotoga sp. BS]CAH1194081.1 40-residue YVTN family beta-propeller repeat-containing protein [Candidatus Nitrotoga sp. BS]